MNTIMAYEGLQNSAWKTDIAAVTAPGDHFLYDPLIMCQVVLCRNSNVDGNLAHGSNVNLKENDKEFQTMSFRATRKDFSMTALPVWLEMTCFQVWGLPS